MLPTDNILRTEIPRLIADRMALRGEIRDLRVENSRLRTIIRLMRDPRIAQVQSDPACEDRGEPAFDWRHVLHNPQFGWPTDVVADAEAMRMAELRRGVTAHS